ncbi:bacterial proteasome activator family protein [Nocardioides sp. B-3]|uniref:bacterial proteasome activator family protein n=1 Tax=Nocardioides sp. B-3 TaxID=2895565 RepID=UPI0021535E98|nr:bacterial proteasome activator family protein [Nocardioides sp. B-3]UUZ60980.1 bacterial proteasome activator family protein [Nocardioides sp. B-3]
MTEEQTSAEEQIVIVGPDGQPVGTIPKSALPTIDETDEGDGERHITELVEQPAKVMRIGSMIRQLLEEVKAAPLDEASRNRLKEIHRASIKELEAGLAPELVEELERLSLPFTEDGIPSEGELRIAQAQLVGWLEGLFHGIQTAIYAQQMAARGQLEQMRKALPGMAPQPDGQPGPGQPQGMRAMPKSDQNESGGAGGMYL